MENKTKKILRISQGEWLLYANKDSVATTKNKDMAMDITDWNFNQLSYFISNLRKVGYIGAKVEQVEVVGEVIEDAVEDNG